MEEEGVAAAQGFDDSKGFIRIPIGMQQKHHSA